MSDSREALRDRQAAQAAGRQFATTHWSIIFLAARDQDAAARDALEELCRAYWYPLYAKVRSQGHSKEDACDLVQAFFERLIENNTLNVADPTRGRFRTFLMSCLQHYLCSEWRRQHAIKRGGRTQVVSIDEVDAEQRYLNEPVDRMTPDKVYERTWALTLLNRAYETLRRQFSAAGRIELFDALWPFFTGGADQNDDYKAVAARLRMTEGAVKTNAHRLRQRFGECLRTQIAQTVSQKDDVEEELLALFAALRT